MEGRRRGMGTVSLSGDCTGLEQEALRGSQLFPSRPTICTSPLHPRQRGRAAPLLAPCKRWLAAGVWGCGAEAHPSSPDPPRPGAHPAQCTGRLGVGSAQSRTLEPGCLVSPRVRGSSAPLHLPGCTGSMPFPSGPSSASLSPLVPS